jgi:hypothetical protein
MEALPREVFMSAEKLRLFKWGVCGALWSTAGLGPQYGLLLS